MKSFGKTPFKGKYNWDLNYATRIDMLYEKSIRIAYVHNEANQSTFRYRCFNMAKKINETLTDYSAAWFYYNEIDFLIEDMNKIDVMVVCRMQFDSQVARLISYAKLKKIVVLFDVDDLVVDVTLIPLIVSTVTTIPSERDREAEMWNYWYSYVGRLQATMNECDAILCSTPNLAKSIRKISEQKVAVVENFMGGDQISYSNSLFATKEVAREYRSSMRLGYFSGSPSHNKDFRMALPAIADFLAKSKSHSILLVGNLDVDVSLLSRFPSQIDVRPITDYLNLQRLISEVDLNLIPLQDNSFTRAKSVLKYFDAAIVGTISLASPVGELKHAIKQNENGYFAKDEDWLLEIESITTLTSETRTLIARQAHHDATLRHAGDQSIHALQIFLNQLM